MNKTLEQQHQRDPMGYARWKMILDDSQKPIDATILEVNPAFENYFGLSNDDLNGQSKFELFKGFYEGAEQEWLNKYYQVSNCGHHFVEVVHFEPLNVSFELDVFSTVEGEFVTLFKDASSWQRDLIYRDILNHMSDAILLIETSGEFNFVSPGVTNLFGYEEKEFWEFKNIQSVFGDDFLHKIYDVNSDSKVVSIELETSDKEGYAKEILVDIVQLEESPLLLLVCKDMTSKNSMLRQLDHQKSHLRSIINTIPDLIWIKDPNGVYLNCNREFEVFYGATEDEIIGNSDYDYVSEELADFFRENDLAAIDLGKPRKNEETLTYVDGSKRIIVETTKTPVYDGENNVLGVLGIARDITERKKESTLFKAVFAQSPYGIALVADDGKPYQVNESLCKLLGYNQDELVNMRFEEFTHPEDYPKDIELFNKLHKGEIESYEIEKRYISKQGVIKYANLIVTMIDDHFAEDGKRALAMVEDISSKIKAKLELDITNQRYKHLIETAPDGVYITSSKGIITDVNEAASKMTGYTRGELLGMSIWEIDRSMDEVSILKLYNEMKEGDSRMFESEHANKEGKIIQVEVSINAVKMDNETWVIGMIRDVSARKNIELQLRSNEAKYKGVIATSSDAMYLVSMEGKILETNREASAMLGYSNEELLQMTISDIDTGWSKERIIQFGKKLKEEKRALFETTHLTKSGEKIPIEMSLQFFEFEGVPMVVSFGRDITERKKIEDELKQTNKSLEKYHLFFENSQDNFCIANSEGFLVETNPKFPESLGYDAGFLTGKSFLDFIHPDDLKKTIKEMERLNNGELTINFQNRYKSKSGEYRYFDWGATPHNGLYYAVARDITEQIEAFREKEESELKYRNLIETAADAIYLLNKEGKILDANNASFQMTGFSKNELLNSFIGKINKGYQTVSQYQELVKDFEANKSYLIESSHTTKDGRQIPVEINIRVVIRSTEEYYLAIVRDISERKNSEREMKNVYELLVRAQNITKMGSWSLDVNKNELRWSDEIFRIFDEEPQSFKGTVEGFYDFVHPEDRELVQNYFNECVEERKDYHLVHRILTKKGAIKFVEENATFEYDESQNLLIALGTVQDITETELYQRELRLRDENLHKFFENVDIGIAKNSMSGEFIEINPEFERFTGYSVEELNKMSYWDLTPQKYEDQEALQLKSLQEHGRYGPYQKEYISKTGDLVPILLNGVKTLDAEGNEYIWSIIQDITESEGFKHKLEQDVEKLKILLDTGKLIALEVNLRSNEIKTIREKVKIDGISFPIDKIRTTSDFFQSIRKEHRTLCERKFEALKNKEIDSFSCDIQIKAGSEYFWHEGKISVLRVDEDSNPVVAFITLRNIEEEKLDERRQLVSQEQERLRISRDIHDSIGQMLVGTRLTLQMKKDEVSDLSDVDEMLDNMIKESRLIINNFGISLEKAESLKNSFVSLAEKMNKVYSGEIVIHWHGSKIIEDLKQATNIFRIYQEALSNAIKYSNSSQIRVNIRNYDVFFMDIIDFGDGFDPENIDYGFGTSNMKSRAKEINGNVTIESSPGNGTLVRLRFFETRLLSVK